MNIKILHKLGLHNLSGEMAVNGTLLLIFSLILLGFKPVSGTTPWESIYVLNLIPPPSSCFNMALRIIHIVISLILIFVIPWIWRIKLRSSLKGYWKATVLWVMRFLELAIFVFLLWLVLTISISWYEYLGYISGFVSVVFMVAVVCKWLACKFKESLSNQFQFLYWEIFLSVYVVSWLTGFASIPARSFASNLVFYVGFVWFIVICIVMLKPFPKSGEKTDQTKKPVK